jgi:hypothetical protein
MICTLISVCSVVVILISGTKETLLPNLYYVRVCSFPASDSHISSVKLTYNDSSTSAISMSVVLEALMN